MSEQNPVKDQPETNNSEYSIDLSKHRLIGPGAKIYISGPISGYADLNAPAFEAAEEVLKKQGLIPVNPLKINDTDIHGKGLSPKEVWCLCMKADVREMMGVDALYMLPNWVKSKGAIKEFLIAKTLKIPVFTPTFELIILTKKDYSELFYNITDVIEENDKILFEDFLIKKL